MGVLVPFLCLYAFDWIMFIIILTSIVRNKMELDTEVKARGSLRSHKENFTVALSLLFMFGLGWGFGLLATSYPSQAVTITFQVIFSIFAGSQGILLFLLHGLRNSDARRVWKKWWTCCSKVDVSKSLNSLDPDVMYGPANLSRTMSREAVMTRRENTVKIKPAKKISVVNVASCNAAFENILEEAP